MRPTFTVALPELLDRIVAEAMTVLATVGTEVRGPALRQRLREAGLPTTADGQRIRFPEETVVRALSTAPRRFLLYNREGEPYAEMGGDEVYFAPGSSGLRVLDHRTGQIRLAQTADFVEYIRLVDGLEHIAFAATAFSTHDIENRIADAWRLYLALPHTRKPLVSGAFTEHGVPRLAEMLALFRRDRADLAARPFAVFTITATGNFRYSEDSCQNLLDCLEWGIPVEIVPLTIMGLIAPVTPVGAAVFHVADVLAGITMAQVLKPGHPVFFGGGAATFHMREATSPMPAVEALRLVALYTAVGRHLGLPTQAYTATSESKQLDAQAGAETWASVLNAAMAGLHLVSGPGMLDYLLTFHLPKLVFDNEVCGQVRAYLRPVEVQEDLPTLAMVEHELAEGHMLTAPHTLKHWPEQLYLPGPIWDRMNLEGWQRTGSKTLQERAVAEVEARLAAYQPPPTDPALVVEMGRILTAGLGEIPLPEVPPLPPPSAPRPSRSLRRERRTTA